MFHFLKNFIIFFFIFAGVSMLSSFSQNSFGFSSDVNEEIKKQNQKLLNAKTKKLKNGLEVIVVKTKLGMKVSIGVLYHVGSADDPENLIGISHMLEHMIFHGTKKYPEFDKSVGELGGAVNAFTSYDCTMFVTEIRNAFIEKIFEMEADRMVNLKITEDGFQKERKAVAEERSMYIENRPTGIVNEILRRHTYAIHPYGVEVIGHKKHIEDYTLEALEEHYKKWYAPNNATLIVVGNVQEEEIFFLAEKHFGEIKEREIKKRVRPMDPITEGLTELIIYENKEVPANSVTYIYRIDGEKTVLKKLLIETLLSTLYSNEGMSFYKKFVDKLKIPQISMSSLSLLEDDKISIDFILPKNLSHENFNEKYHNFVKELLIRGFNEADFNDVIENFKNSLCFALDGNKKIRNSLAELASGSKLEDIENSYEYYEKIQKRDVRSLMHEIFEKKPLITVFFKIPKNQDDV